MISVIRLTEAEKTGAVQCGITCAYCDFPVSVKTPEGTWYCSGKCAQIAEG